MASWSVDLFVGLDFSFTCIEVVVGFQHTLVVGVSTNQLLLRIDRYCWCTCFLDITNSVELIYEHNQDIFGRSTLSCKQS